MILVTFLQTHPKYGDIAEGITTKSFENLGDCSSGRDLARMLQYGYIQVQFAAYLTDKEYADWSTRMSHNEYCAEWDRDPRPSTRPNYVFFEMGR